MDDVAKISFKYVRFDKNWSDVPLVPTGNMEGLARLAFHGRPSADEDNPLAHAVRARMTNAKRARRGEGDILRQKELEEVAAYVVKQLRLYRSELAASDPDYHNENPPILPEEWFDGIEFREMAGSAYEEGLPEFTLTLSTGRIADETVMAAAIALLQCERAVHAYMEKNIDALSYLLCDVAAVTSAIQSDFMFEDHKIDRSVEARKRGKMAHLGTPRSKAMSAIHDEFDRWQAGKVRYENDAQFAIKMRLAHPDITNEGSIKNACTRWRRGRNHPAGIVSLR